MGGVKPAPSNRRTFSLVYLSATGPWQSTFCTVEPLCSTSHNAQKMFLFLFVFLPWAVSKIENEMSLKSPATNVANFYSLFLVFLIHQCR